MKNVSHWTTFWEKIMKGKKILSFIVFLHGLHYIRFFFFCTQTFFSSATKMVLIFESYLPWISFYNSLQIQVREPSFSYHSVANHLGPGLVKVLAIQAVGSHHAAMSLVWQKDDEDTIWGPNMSATKKF